ncbi:undecaprenyldiphospho-muramoylpentapeptide beta-N-acetylglucosaminyltransferase [Paenibacillus sp. Marseille-Q4541]|uniref:undecaprenyldiphospho-muramoylpentapeptide beta-N-acetylglucosaminyltransferase n=1 Tax=Paenibacillus sp. Marseille-Q4541 TaxID=2831522 RepID=UPI001BAD45D3
MKHRKIVFTGGGSAGHVTVNLALIPYFLQKGDAVHYIGSRDGIEKELVQSVEGVTYKGIATGKLRRYLSIQNLKDPLRVLKGVGEAYRYLGEVKPSIVFSKGGFVSVPVVLAAWMRKIPVVIHESDLTPGLANQIALPFATHICTTFQEAAGHLKGKKAIHVGAVVRDELRQGDKERARRWLGFEEGKPVLLFMGGSLGAKKMNDTVQVIVSKLTETYQIVHLCGKGQVNEGMNSIKGYKAFEYLQKELPDVLALADLVISRAGSNAIFEFLSLNKPMLLIPLSEKVSRGDQLLNARSFETSGYAKVLLEEDLSEETLLQSILLLDQNKEKIQSRMLEYERQDAVAEIIKIIESSRLA